MARFPSLPDKPNLAEVFGRFSHGTEALLSFHDTILRGPSPLSVGERELIAAYVSGLNACSFCAGSHQTIARAYGVDFSLFQRLQEDLAAAPVDPRLKPILEYVRKLTKAPASVTDKDAERVYAAGWDERALYDAVVVCALFNFMNRLVEGTGVVREKEALQEYRAKWAKMTPEERDAWTYSGFGRQARTNTDQDH